MRNRDLASLTQRQNRLYQFAVQHGTVSKAGAAQFLGISGDTALREVKILMKHGLLAQTGNGRGTRYVAATGGEGQSS